MNNWNLKRPKFLSAAIFLSFCLTTSSQAQSPPTVTIQPTNNTIAVEVGSNVTLAASVDGTGPFSYQWQLNGTNLPAGGVITTIAGGGVGDSGAAISASLFDPSGVAVDSTGDLFIADTRNNRIRKVDTNGVITTVAGNGNNDYSGNGGAATNASLFYPGGVAVDAVGNLFIADTGNQRIRKVGTNGIITTVAGNSIRGYSGDGGAATNASLANPSDVIVDAAGDLFIADYGNNRIRKVSTNGIITTVAGDGIDSYSGDGGVATNASLGEPSGVAVDAAGNLFIAERFNSCVRKVDTNGIITTVAGNGSFGYPGDGVPATNSSLDTPSGVTVDAAGDLFIADTGINFILKVDTNGILTIVAGNGSSDYSGDGGAATNASLNQPEGVAVDTSGNVFIADTDNNRIRKVDANNIITTVAGGGVGDGVAARNAVLNLPQGVAVDPAGNLFIADTSNQRIRKVNTNGVITTVAGIGNGAYSGDGGAATNASLDQPESVAVDAADNLFVADTYNSRIRKVSSNGIIMTAAGGLAGFSGDGGAATNAGLIFPGGVAVDPAGNLFIADTGDNRIRKVDTNDIITTVAGNGTAGYSSDGGSATNATLGIPSGVAVDPAGNLFIADTSNQRIRKVDTNGVITTVAGIGNGAYSGDGGAATNASLFYPGGVAVDATGDLFIADTDNNRIRKVDTNGVITTVAGNGGDSYYGDGGAATNASLDKPSGVAVDAAGDLFIADTYNNCIRKVTPASGATLVLSDVGIGNAGAYDVVVSSPYGSVTSSVVNVTVTLPQIILSAPQVAVAKGNFTFQLSGPASTNYVLQVSTNLTDWNSISTSSIPISGSITISNTISGYNRRFYRVYLQ